jgi:predicted lactoylglutathione lyase
MYKTVLVCSLLFTLSFYSNAFDIPNQKGKNDLNQFFISDNIDSLLIDNPHYKKIICNKDTLKKYLCSNNLNEKSEYLLLNNDLAIRPSKPLKCIKNVYGIYEINSKKYYKTIGFYIDALFEIDLIIFSVENENEMLSPYGFLKFNSIYSLSPVLFYQIYNGLNMSKFKCNDSDNISILLKLFCFQKGDLIFTDELRLISSIDG